MRQFNKEQRVRMALALAATLLIGGSGLAFAAGPSPTYVPKSSVLLGPSTVAPGGSANYVLEVTFVNGAVLDFPPTTGATFSVVTGSINSATGAYTAPSVGPRDRVTGSFAQNGVLSAASRIIAIR